MRRHAVLATFLLLASLTVFSGSTDALAATSPSRHAPPTPSSSPVNTALPKISGTAVQGQTLIAAAGSWTNSPTSYAYQWQDCDSSGGICFNISGATAGSYVPASGDVNDTIRVVVSAANASGSASATSAPTAPIGATATDAQASASNAQVSSSNAQVLLVGNSTVESAPDNDASGSAEAFRFTASAAGRATSASVYVDRGSKATQLSVGLYSDDGGQPGSLLASGTGAAPVAGSWASVTLTSSPTLTSGATYWLSVLGTGGTLNFRDVRAGGQNCSDNSSQTSLTSLPASWSRGTSWTTCSLSAYVAGTAQTGTTPTPPSTPPAPVNTALPAISGQTVQGDVLTATNGSWSNAPTSYTYQWQDCNSSGASCTNIGGATSSTHTLASGDVGQTLRAVITATNAGGPGSATSGATAVTTAPQSTPPPTTGTVPCPLTHAAGADGTNSCWATNTGVQNGTGFTEAQILAGQSSLKHVVGDQTISTAGTVISNEWISGCIAIDANNVTIKDSLVYPNGDNCSGGGGGSQASAINDGQDSAPTGTLIEDTTVDGNNSDGDQYGVSLVHGQCVRCNIFGFAKEFWADGSASAPTTFQDSYAHDFSSNTGTAHLDGIFLDSSNYVTIEHSYVIATGANSYVAGAVVSGSDWGAPTHQTVDDSYMEGDNGFDWHGACGATYMQMTNDAFSSNEKSGFASGPWLASDTGNNWSGNYVAESPSSTYGVPGPGSC